MVEKDGGWLLAAVCFERVGLASNCGSGEAGTTRMSSVFAAVTLEGVLVSSDVL